MTCVVLTDQLVLGQIFVCVSTLDMLPLLSRASAMFSALPCMAGGWSADGLFCSPWWYCPVGVYAGVSLIVIIKDATGGVSTLLPHSEKG